MTDRRFRVRRTLAFGVAGLNAMLLLGGVVLLAIAGVTGVWSRSLIAIVYTSLALLIISRQPRHTVGWLFLLVGFASAGEMFLYGIGQVVTLDSTSRLQVALFLIGLNAWIPTLLIPLTLVLQFFPNGRLPSRRWWPIPAASVFGMLGIAAVESLRPWTSEDGFPVEVNPFAIPGTEPFIESLLGVAETALAIGVLGSLVILIVRFRRADTVERTQMKWLFYPAAVGIPLMLSINGLGPLLGMAAAETIAVALLQILPAVLILAMGIAILRYRLFDIDVIIRRTMQYGIVTALLALVYFGLVVIFQAFVSDVGDQQSGIFIVISTLVIAALFNPLRLRVQAIVDRRFYRRKYQAEQALAQFATAARDEVELDRLMAALMQVVEETMQPEQASLVLVQQSHADGGSGEPRPMSPAGAD